MSRTVLFICENLDSQIRASITLGINTEECLGHNTLSTATRSIHVRNSIVCDLEVMLHGYSTENYHVFFIVSYK